MADSLALHGAHAAAAPTPDEIALLHRTMNNLSRAQRELLEPDPDFIYIRRQLDQASQAVNQMAGVEAAAAH